MKQSEPIVPPSKPLGLVLQRAALVSASQIEVALRDRQEYKEMRIGEILALHGWVKAQTANFFAERWPLLLKQKWGHPLGYYLQEAALLNEEQVDIIIVEQHLKETRLLFGELVIEKQWLNPITIDFFLQAKESYNYSLTLSDLIDRVLNSSQITSSEQERFLAMMLQQVTLSASELDGIQEIFKRIQTGRLQIVR